MTMTTRSYTSPQSFKQALEQRLRTATSDGTGLLELRLERARTTKDIDLTSNRLARNRACTTPGSRTQGSRRLHDI